ncbi:hypothetical protein EYC84_003579 [Monilinia fructicola]|uniref:Uncharacterized protein n=1 Tax=Monilinia fructicola TaxID=38448 RepID=A0A5M9JV05_MONFR|nr:hypothetical protein EYC84_003579 [Monilinia fructicola]
MSFYQATMNGRACGVLDEAHRGLIFNAAAFFNLACCISFESISIQHPKKGQQVEFTPRMALHCSLFSQSLRVDET